MKWVSRCKRLGVLNGLLCVVLLVSAESPGSPKDHSYRQADVDIPVSLAIGTVRTPAFTVVREAYFIMLQVKKPLPFQQMVCMMGVTQGPLDSKECTSDDPLLRADWTVWDGDHVASTGSGTPTGHGKFTNDHIIKVLGMFVANEAGRQYVVEVNFTHDGTPLNVANPHLIVIRVKYH